MTVDKKAGAKKPAPLKKPAARKAPAKKKPTLGHQRRRPVGS